MSIKNLDPETFTIKVISIDKNSLSDNLFNTIKDNYTYKDTQIKEHLYGCNLIEDIDQEKPINKQIKEELNSIRDLCIQNDSAYFRIVSL